MGAMLRNEPLPPGASNISAVLWLPLESAEVLLLPLLPFPSESFSASTESKPGPESESDKPEDGPKREEREYESNCAGPLP